MMEMKAEEFAARVGIDWADQKHAWALQAAGGEVEHGELDHTPEAVELWATKLAQRFNGRAIAVALEQARGSLIFMLTKYAHLVIFPVHGATLANYRKGFRPSGAKSDPSDADLFCWICWFAIAKSCGGYTDRVQNLRLRSSMRGKCQGKRFPPS